uniref:Uncharacterized protein n=1 Tax=Cucumis sativus TaxID=3659 RepID=A0A0A0K0E5_CUCSA
MLLSVSPLAPLSLQEIIHVQQQPVVSPTDFNHGIIMDQGNTIGALSSTSTTTHPPTKQQQDQEEEKYWEADVITKRKMNELAKYLVETNIEFVMHVVKDSEVKERLAVEINNFLVLRFHGAWLKYQVLRFSTLSIVLLTAARWFSSVLTLKEQSHYFELYIFIYS